MREKRTLQPDSYGYTHDSVGRRRHRRMANCTCEVFCQRSFRCPTCKRTQPLCFGADNSEDGEHWAECDDCWALRNLPLEMRKLEKLLESARKERDEARTLLKELAEVSSQFVERCVIESCGEECVFTACGKPATHMGQVRGHETNLLCDEHAEQSRLAALKAASKGAHSDYVRQNSPYPIERDPRGLRVLELLEKVLK